MSNILPSVERLIKKYPNRRLYDTLMSRYITMQDVKDMVRSHQAFTVADAKTGEDLTRSILLQIVLEEETKGAPLFSTPFLLQIIRYYGDAMQHAMGACLEKNVQAFIDILQRLPETALDSDGKTFTPEMWAQFMTMQGPMIQSMMSSYLEQSKALFLQTQEQMQEQAKSMIDNFPFTQEEQA